MTGNNEYLNFAYWLLEERGHGHGSKGGEGEWNSQYYQDVTPVKDLSEITGHAVRAMYQFCAMADIAALKQETDYFNALERLWDDVVNKKMYITGGIGSSRHNEGFTEPYDLPNYEAYCETCASVGMVLWNSRMNQLTGDSKYSDVMERSLYNGTLAGVALSGDRFFYVNPLASHGDHHRKEWYGTACCPSQISRFLPSVGNYIYGQANNTVWVNLYMGNRAEINTENGDIIVNQITNYPWDGEILINIEDIPIKKKTDIRFRIPGWCKSFTIALNSEAISNPIIDKGYVTINRKWSKGDQISLNLEMPVEVIQDIPQVKENIGKRAIQRGPLVYCVEKIDNPDFNNLSVSDKSAFTTTYNPDLLNGVMSIKATLNDQNSDDLVSFIPYYAWDNREAGEMKVWIDYTE